MKTVLIFLLTFLMCSESFSQFGGIAGCRAFQTQEKSSNTYGISYFGVAAYLPVGPTWASMNFNMTIPSEINISKKSAKLQGFESQVSTGMTIILNRLINKSSNSDTTKKRGWRIFPFMGFNYGILKLKFDNETSNYHNFYFAPMLNTTLYHYYLKRTSFKSKINYGVSLLISCDITNRSWKNNEGTSVDIDKPRTLMYGVQLFFKI
jgi:hypothetical protein